MSHILTRARPLQRIATGASALVLAAGLALAGSAAPAAAADRGDAARAILGVTALGLLVHQLGKDTARADSRRADPPARPRPGEAHRREARALPASCAFRIASRGRSQTVLERSCVESRAQRPRALQLPAACAVRADHRDTRDRRGWDKKRPAPRGTLYGVDCLKRAGFTLDRRR